ncbi:ThiJ/PfpI family protein [Hypoxylon cercidicola]|nr:ThiJ/PfpI family protein [Hypoxylon cercidicola]
MADTKTSGTGDKHTVRVGVFIPADCQLLDAASVDIMGSMSHEYMSMISQLVPQAVIDLAPHVHIHYIGSVRAGEHIKLTSNERIVATNHYSDAEVAPGKLDVVLVPGPDPFNKYEEAAIEWLRTQGNTQGVDILSVCSGILICGEAGLLKGRSACGPRGLQDMIKSKGFGEKALVGHKFRWIQDGNFWSSGGVTNGNDLVAAYCRASPHFPNPIVEMICESIDVGDRAQEYGKEMMWQENIAKLAETAL